MRQRIEVVLIFLFLVVFSIATIYPVLNILGVSLRTDNAFQTRSLSLLQSAEVYEDLNNDGTWNSGEPFRDENKNGVRDSGSSINSYISLVTETNFLLWLKNSMFISLAVTYTGVVLASIGGYSLSRFRFKGRDFGMIAKLTTQMFPATMLLLPFFILLSHL